MCGLVKTEWAHALAGGLSVREASGSIGQRPIVPEAVERIRYAGKQSNSS